jgi:hypothetical protein
MAEALRDHGYEIPLNVPPEVPRYHAPRNGKGCTAHGGWLRETLPELLAVDAIEEVPSRLHIGSAEIERGPGARKLNQ